MTQAVGWGYSEDYILEMPFSQFRALTDSINFVKNAEHRKGAWLMFAATKAKDQDAFKKFIEEFFIERNDPKSMGDINDFIKQFGRGK